MHERYARMVFNREEAMRHTDECPPRHPRKLSHEGYLSIRASYMFEHGIRGCDVEALIGERQRLPGLDLLITDGWKGSLERHRRTEAHGRDPVTMRIFPFEHIGRLAHNVRDTHVENFAVGLGPGKFQKIRVDPIPGRRDQFFGQRAWCGDLIVATVYDRII